MVATADLTGIAVFNPSTGRYSSSSRADSIDKGTLVAEANFNDGELIPSSIHTGVVWDAFNDTRTIEAGKLKVDYTAGQAYPALSLSVRALNVSEVFIDFDAAMPGNKGGLKFVKIYCVNDSEGPNYCNCTFGIEYNDRGEGIGSIYTISYGDGTEESNDTQNGIWLDGIASPPTLLNIGRSYGIGAAISTPQNRNFAAADWGVESHHFEMRAKFNSGSTSENEVNNGALRLSIDGDLFANATGLFNSHPSNSKIIDRIEFSGYAQSNPDPFYMLFDNIKVRAII